MSCPQRANRRLVGRNSHLSCALCAVLSFVLPLFATAQKAPAPPRLLDYLNGSDPASCAAHVVQGQSLTTVREKAQIGTLLLPVSGMRIPPGSSLQAVLKRGTASSLLVTLATVPGDYGKRQNLHLRLDGQEWYHVVEADPGGGIARSFVVDLLPAASPELTACRFEIAADPNSEVPLLLVSVRVYSGISPFQSTRRTAAPPMGLALVSRQGGGYGLDRDELAALSALVPNSPYLIRQAAVLYNFCVRTAAENQAEIHRLAALAESANVPLRIAFQLHWGGSPKGVSDGAGGTFTDLPYQQITFDPDNQREDTALATLMGERYEKSFGLSVPNRWSDTPWLTYNHPRLNQLRRIRLTQALSAWRGERERLSAAGKAMLLPLELSTGEETVYWAKGVDDTGYTAANGNKARNNLMADFNPFVVAEALHDGVNLDPRDGLDKRERLWLHTNLAQQQQRIVDWMREALPPDSIQTNATTPLFAGDLPRRNLFTEPYAMTLFPMRDLSPYHPGLEVGYVKEGRSGGAYGSGATMLPWLTKERERGRIALPNLECTGTSDPQLLACLRAAYANGARFATLYNWKERTNIRELLAAFAESIEIPTGIGWLPEAKPTSSLPIGSLLPKTSGNPEAKSVLRWTREYTAPPDAFGVNTVEMFVMPVKAAGRTEGVGVRITVEEVGAANGTRWQVQTGFAAMQSLAGKPEQILRLPLPLLIPQKPGQKYLVTIEETTPNTLSLSDAVDGKPALRLLADIALERARSGVIAEWQDAADLLQSLSERAGHVPPDDAGRQMLVEAKRRFAGLRPQEAYRIGIRAEQLMLPAAWRIPKGGGKLLPYEVTILSPKEEITATLRAFSRESLTISLRSMVAQTVTIRRGSDQTTAALSPNVPAEVTLLTKPTPLEKPANGKR